MGRFVTATANVGLTAKGTVSGYLIVGGLPFKAENQPGGMPTWSAAVSYFSLTGNFTWIGGHIYPGRSDVLLTGEATTGGAIAQLLDVSVLSDSSAVFLTVSYLAVE
jgi:hypothetical protein